MKLGRRQIAELVAVVGVVVGLCALWIGYVNTKYTGGTTIKYADDGTVMAAGIVILGLAACCLAASLLLGKVDLDLTAAVAGAVAFGFFLFIPAAVAFKSFGHLGSGAWLGICAGLVPLGAGAAQLWHRRSDAKAPGVTLWTVGAVIGLVLIVVGIWSKVTNDGFSYWNSSASGHALGLLLLILAIVSAILIAIAVTARKAELADLALIVSGILVGLAVAEGIHDAFGSFGDMGTGAWLALAGGLVLLLSLIGSYVVKLPELMKK